jgi:formylglycine-generating enzyme required for sulfatase activity
MTIATRLPQEPDVTIGMALILSLGEIEPNQWTQSDRNVLIPVLVRSYRTHPDPGFHGAVEWLLRKWNQQDKVMDIDEQVKKEREERVVRIGRQITEAKGEAKPQWYVNSQSQTMVVIPAPGKFKIGSPPTEPGRETRIEGEGRAELRHEKCITHSFAIASKKVTVAQYVRFKEERFFSKYYFPKQNWQDCPMPFVTWYDAAEYCNWLSKQEGLEPVYEANEKDKFARGMKVKPNYLRLSGYRLPSEAEWEYACRAGTETSRYYGETPQLLEKYAWTRRSSMGLRLSPVGCLKPNDLGLFDMLGNAEEWCHGGYFILDVDLEDKEDTQVLDDNKMRSVRGGSFLSEAHDLRSACRSWGRPGAYSADRGFRPVRTFP